MISQLSNDRPKARYVYTVSVLFKVPIFCRHYAAIGNEGSSAIIEEAVENPKFVN
jgi:hypothetical protein